MKTLLSTIFLTLFLVAAADARLLLGTVQDEESGQNWGELSKNLLQGGDTFPSEGYVVVGKQGSVFVSTITGTRRGLNEAPITILASVPYKTYVIHDIVVMSSGQVTGSTSLDVEETDGTDVAKYLSALLADDQPVHLASATQEFAPMGLGLQRGRGVRLNLNVDTAGDTDSGASHIYYNILYSLQ